MYKCKICGVNEVDFSGGVCELCSLTYDPAAEAAAMPKSSVKRPHMMGIAPESTENQTYIPKHSSGRKRILVNGGAEINNTDPYGNVITPQQDVQNEVKVYSAGQVPQTVTNITDAVTPAEPKAVRNSRNEPITKGITKNIMVDTEKKSGIAKWFRSLIKGVPFTTENEITMFQVFPDFTGSALNASGNACDQVIVYGKINNGVISENNDVEVFGYRDSSNNIIAATVKNIASGTIITPNHSISAGVVRGISIFGFACLIALFL